MEKDYKEMDWSNNYTYNDKCSFYESGKGMFKLDKTEFYA
jgi:hypothetical protein